MGDRFDGLMMGFVGLVMNFVGLVMGFDGLVMGFAIAVPSGIGVTLAGEFLGARFSTI